MRYLKKIIKISILPVTLVLISVFGADFWVENATENKVFNSVEEIPQNRVGLLLGTGKFLASGRVNLYYEYRIDAAVKLYKSGKIDYVLVSGDNSTKNYDEPSTMKDDLVKHGIPQGEIYLDYAGFRTLDSVVRCKEIFGQDSITVISQQFHNERAIFIAQQKGISAVGYNAKGVSTRYGIRVQIRERLARVKMILDLLIGKKPKFLGKKIEIK